MKRILILAAAVFGAVATLPAQDAAAIADQQAAQENYQALAGKVDDLVTANQLQLKRIADLENQVHALQDAQSQPNTNAVDPASVRDLAEKVQEIDQKREADKELILKQIADLATLPAPGATGSKHKHKAEAVDTTTSDTTSDTAATPAPDTGGDNKNYEGYEYVVKSGDTLTAIVTAYNKQAGLHLTVEQVLKHPLNAKVKPEKLRVGQKIFIPGATN
jgi:hypothetical protein